MTMKLPSSVCGVTTETVGLFRCSPDRLAQWSAKALGEEWRTRSMGFASLEELCRYLTPGERLAHRALAPWGEWTLMLTDGPLGTDTGVLPSRVAKKLGCMGIRATAVDPQSESYAAVILEVFDPAATEDLLRCRRTITAADDGGRWVFSQFGKPFDFEDLDAYSRRRIRDRFTAGMLSDYLRFLGVPLGTDPDFNRTLLVENDDLVHLANLDSHRC